MYCEKHWTGTPKATEDKTEKLMGDEELETGDSILNEIYASHGYVCECVRALTTMKSFFTMEK
jgi:hypothetical protein